MFIETIGLAINGLDLTSEGLLLNRVVLGTFFAISGFHKLFITERHQQLVNVLEEDGIPMVRFCEWFVPIVELVAGVFIVVGLFAPLAAIGIIVLMVVAFITDGVKRVSEYNPINAADYLDGVLYLPETVYIVMSLILILAGPGKYIL